HRMHQALKEILGLVPPGEAFILADQDEWAMSPAIAGRYRLPFPNHDGQYGGTPADDASAIAELEGLLPSGAGFLVFAWPAFWWLDAYTGFHQYLRFRFRPVLENDRLIVFDLQTKQPI